MKPKSSKTKKKTKQMQSRKQPLENEFETWWNHLDEEGRTRVDGTISTTIPRKGVAREAARMKYFRREVMRSLIR